KREGHGPHALALAERVEHVWMEPEAGQARVPDAWLVTVPAPIDARIELTGEMQGELVRTDGEGAAVSVPTGRGWKGKLEAGRDRRLDARARGGGGAAARAARQDGRRTRGQRAGLPAPGAARGGVTAGRGERAGERRLRARGGRAHGRRRGGADGARRGAAGERRRVPAAALVRRWARDPGARDGRRARAAPHDGAAAPCRGEAGGGARPRAAGQRGGGGARPSRRLPRGRRRARLLGARRALQRAG